MSDDEIIELLNNKDEGAITAVKGKYYSYLYKISFQIVGNHEDAEECLNDILLELWNTSYPKSYKELYAIDPELTYCMDTDLGDTESRYHDESEVYVKRIIGLPGEKIEIRSGRIYINDFIVPLSEPYLDKKPLGNFGPYYVPDDCYFCLGDNRNKSSDAREWDNTVDDPSDPDYDPDRFRFVHKDKIYAKAWLKIIPGLHWINHCDYENS